MKGPQNSFIHISPCPPTAWIPATSVSQLRSSGAMRGEFVAVMSPSAAELARARAFSSVVWSVALRIA